MGTYLRAPAVGWATESVVYRWWQDDGDWVTPGTAICTLSAGTLLHTIFSLESGFLRVPFAEVRQVGTAVQRGTPLGFILQPGESAADIRGDLPTFPDVPNKCRFTWDSRLYEAACQAAAGKIAASPRARHKARQRAVSLSNLTGTGHRGAIREKDVAAAEPQAAAGQRQHDLAAMELEFPLPTNLRTDRNLFLQWTLCYLNDRLEWKYRNQPGAVARWQESTLAWSYFDGLASALRNEPATTQETTHPAPWQWSKLSWAVLDLRDSPFRRFVPPLVHGPSFVIVLTDSSPAQSPQHASKRNPTENTPPVTISVLYDWNIVPISFWYDLFLALGKHCQQIE